jgi:hypothetical protein
VVRCQINSSHQCRPIQNHSPFEHHLRRQEYCRAQNFSRTTYKNPHLEGGCYFITCCYISFFWHMTAKYHFCSPFTKGLTCGRNNVHCNAPIVLTLTHKCVHLQHNSFHLMEVKSLFLNENVSSCMYVGRVFRLLKNKLTALPKDPRAQQGEIFCATSLKCHAHGERICAVAAFAPGDLPNLGTRGMPGPLAEAYFSVVVTGVAGIHSAR